MAASEGGHDNKGIPNNSDTHYEACQSILRSSERGRHRDRRPDIPARLMASQPVSDGRTPRQALRRVA